MSPKQLKFSEISGIDNTLLSALEKGRQHIRAEHLALLADAGIDVGYVITGRKSGADLPDSESLLLKFFRMAEEEDRSLLLSMAARLTAVSNTQARHQQIHGVRLRGPSESLHDKSPSFRGEESDPSLGADQG